MPLRPVWAEVSRSRLLHNYELLRRRAGAAELLCVVKANAYGHGAVECAGVLAAQGARWLGVTSAEEGAAVRAACPEARVLVMCGIGEQDAALVVAQRLTPVVWESFHLEWLAKAARAAGVSAIPTNSRYDSPAVPEEDLQTRAKRGLVSRGLAVHIEIDTGMARQGVPPDGLPALLARLRATPELRLEGVMTHFHSPESSAATAGQMAEFTRALEMIVEQGLRPEWLHAGNSTTVLLPEGQKGEELRTLEALAERCGARAMARPGLALYGYVQGCEAKPEGVAALEPALSWKTHVVSLRILQPGQTVGYGATFRAPGPTRIALLPVGYADGLNRLLSNRGEVLVRGRRVAIAGRISMDLTTIDVTDVPDVEVGDVVTLIGAGMGTGAEGDGVGAGARAGVGAGVGAGVTAYDHAEIAGTIPYEILCNISARVQRVMVD
jgi:alanine racemase